METAQTYLYRAWKRLVLAYLVALVIGLTAGTLLMLFGNIQPQGLYEASTKRLSYVLPVIDRGVQCGVDMGALLFVWNSLGALITISFIHTAALFDPDRADAFPRGLRKIFRGQTRMKLLCYLPGCAKIDAEPLRRLYVWVMVPLLGILLFGIESGLQLSTAGRLFGSFRTAFISLLPHGLVEIPAFSLAGAVAYSAHLRLAAGCRTNQTRAAFQMVETHRRTLPIRKITLFAIGALLAAGIVEAHVTPRLMRLI